MTSKQLLFVDFAEKLSRLSKCKHGKVSAILVSEDFSQIYSIGINGGPAGQEQCCCGEKDAKYGCAHAEQNCLAKNQDYIHDKIMICTKACCPTCATLIVNSTAKIKKFWYLDEFKDNKGLQILTAADIRCTRIGLD